MVVTPTFSGGYKTYLEESILHCLRYMATSSRCLLPSQSEELSLLDMHSVPRVKSYLTSSFGRLQQGGNSPFLILSQETQIKVEDLPTAMGNKTVWCKSVGEISATAAR